MHPLDGFPLLSELTADERRALEGYLEPRELDGGSTLYRSGEEADALYFVLEGSVTVRDGGQSIAELGEVLGRSRRLDRQAQCRWSARSRWLLTLSREAYLRRRDDSAARAAPPGSDPALLLEPGARRFEDSCAI
jgi:signal-transduction protein with cAMP-binding, CBS, and nucleotidyltransferase domain